MDICVSSNFERYLFALCGENPDVLRDWMLDFEKTGKLTIAGGLLTKAQDEMSSYVVTQEVGSLWEFHLCLAIVFCFLNACMDPIDGAFFDQKTQRNFRVLAGSTQCRWCRSWRKFHQRSH